MQDENKKKLQNNFIDLLEELNNEEKELKSKLFSNSFTNALNQGVIKNELERIKRQRSKILEDLDQPTKKQMNEDKNDTEKPKHHKRKFLLRFIILLFVLLAITSIVSGVFYWFQWRPGEIRKACLEEVTNRGGNATTRNNRYRACLVQHGLQPESLYVNYD